MDTKKEVTLEECRNSDFGCSQCLWAGIECKDHKNFKGMINVFGQKSCENYTYCD